MHRGSARRADHPTGFAVIGRMTDRPARSTAGDPAGDARGRRAGHDPPPKSRLRVFAATATTYPVDMDRFELSERWCAWRDLDVIFSAARAAIEAGPFDPPLCEVVFNEEFDPLTVDTLEEAWEYLQRSRVMSMDIILSHIDEDEARLVMRYSGERLQLNGYGSDWTRARAAYGAAQAVLSNHYGITTFKLPKLPQDTVQETRKRLEIEALEAALENVDWNIENR
jgi:hypothetical protein